jgi:hypothetical protein
MPKKFSEDDIEVSPRISSERPSEGTGILMLHDQEKYYELSE